MQFINFHRLKTLIQKKIGRNYEIMNLKLKTFTFNPFQENTYLLYNEKKECIIIDPGCSDNKERNELKQFIDQNNFTPRMLLNTHCHIDHILGDAYVQSEWNLPLLMHSGEQETLEASQMLADVYGIQKPEIPKNISYLDNMKEMKLGNTPLRILFTPGHSPAHISIYYEPDKILISGDVLFRESIGRTDLPGGNHELLIDSIKSQLWQLPDNTIVFPGHGPTTTISYEKKNNPFLQ